MKKRKNQDTTPEHTTQSNQHNTEQPTEHRATNTAQSNQHNTEQPTSTPTLIHTTQHIAANTGLSNQHNTEQPTQHRTTTTTQSNQHSAEQPTSTPTLIHTSQHRATNTAQSNQPNTEQPTQHRPTNTTQNNQHSTEQPTEHRVTNTAQSIQHSTEQPTTAFYGRGSRNRRMSAKLCNILKKGPEIDYKCAICKADTRPNYAPKQKRKFTKCQNYTKCRSQVHLYCLGYRGIYDTNNDINNYECMKCRR